MTPTDDLTDYKFKIVILGSSGVGKTSLVRRFVDGVFSENYKTTIGISIKEKKISVEGKKVKLTLWDTEGIDEDNPIPKKSYIKGAHGFLVVSDGTRGKTLDQALELNKDLQQKTSQHEQIQDGFHTIPFFLVVNKCDLMDQWKFSDEEINERQSTFLDQEGVKDMAEQRIFKTSAKSGINVQDAFLALASQILENYERYDPQKGFDMEP